MCRSDPQGSGEESYHSDAESSGWPPSGEQEVLQKHVTFVFIVNI